METEKQAYILKYKQYFLWQALKYKLQKRITPHGAWDCVLSTNKIVLYAFKSRERKQYI